MAATPFNLAAPWNAGLEGYTGGKAPVGAYPFAGDVQNLYAAADSTTKPSKALLIAKPRVVEVAAELNQLPLKVSAHNLVGGMLGERSVRS